MAVHAPSEEDAVAVIRPVATDLERHALVGDRCEELDFVDQVCDAVLRALPPLRHELRVPVEQDGVACGQDPAVEGPSLEHSVEVVRDEVGDGELQALPRRLRQERLALGDVRNVVRRPVPPLGREDGVPRHRDDVPVAEEAEALGEPSEEDAAIVLGHLRGNRVPDALVGDL